MDAKDYTREFIGSAIRVMSHSNTLFTGVEGEILDETARTFKVRSSPCRR